MDYSTPRRGLARGEHGSVLVPLHNVKAVTRQRERQAPIAECSRIASHPSHSSSKIDPGFSVTIPPSPSLAALASPERRSAQLALARSFETRAHVKPRGSPPSPFGDEEGDDCEYTVRNRSPNSGSPFSFRAATTTLGRHRRSSKSTDTPGDWPSLVATATTCGSSVSTGVSRQLELNEVDFPIILAAVATVLSPTPSRHKEHIDAASPSAESPKFTPTQECQRFTSLSGLFGFGKQEMPATGWSHTTPTHSAVAPAVTSSCTEASSGNAKPLSREAHSLSDDIIVKTMLTTPMPCCDEVKILAEAGVASFIVAPSTGATGHAYVDDDNAIDRERAHEVSSDAAVTALATSFVAALCPVVLEAFGVGRADLALALCADARRKRHLAAMLERCRACATVDAADSSTHSLAKNISLGRRDELEESLIAVDETALSTIASIGRRLHANDEGWRRIARDVACVPAFLGLTLFQRAIEAALVDDAEVALLMVACVEAIRGAATASSPCEQLKPDGNFASTMPSTSVDAISDSARPLRDLRSIVTKSFSAVRDHVAEIVGVPTSIVMASTLESTTARQQSRAAMDTESTSRPPLQRSLSLGFLGDAGLIGAKPPASPRLWYATGAKKAVGVEPITAPVTSATSTTAINGICPRPKMCPAAVSTPSVTCKTVLPASYRVTRPRDADEAHARRVTERIRVAQRSRCLGASVGVLDFLRVWSSSLTNAPRQDRLIALLNPSPDALLISLCLDARVDARRAVQRVLRAENSVEDLSLRNVSPPRNIQKTEHSATSTSRNGTSFRRSMPAGRQTAARPAAAVDVRTSTAGQVPISGDSFGPDGGCNAAHPNANVRALAFAAVRETRIALGRRLKAAAVPSQEAGASIRLLPGPGFPALHRIQPADLCPAIESLIERHPDLAAYRNHPIARARYLTATTTAVFASMPQGMSAAGVPVAELRASPLTDALWLCSTCSTVGVVPFSSRFVERLLQAFDTAAAATARAAETQRVSVRTLAGSTQANRVPMLHASDPDPTADDGATMSLQSYYGATLDVGISEGMLERVFAGAPRTLASGVRGRLAFEDFVWLACACGERMAGPVSLEYWFRVLDADEDGLLSLLDLECAHELKAVQLVNAGIAGAPALHETIAIIGDAIGSARAGAFAMPSMRAECGLSRLDIRRSGHGPLLFDLLISAQVKAVGGKRDIFVNPTALGALANGVVGADC